LAEYVGKVAAAATECLPGYTSVIWKGSTFKPWDGPYDFLPGLSDLDIHVYLPGGPGDSFALRRRLLERVEPPPYDTPLQLLVLDTATLPDWWTLLPGTYRVLAGEPPPVPVPASSLLRERDRMGLLEGGAHADVVATGVIVKRDEQLWDYLRTLRWMFPAVLYRALTIAGEPPEKVWAMNRTEVGAAAEGRPELGELHEAWCGYLEAALEACRRQGAPRPVERALQQGEALLRLGHRWISERPDPPVERRAPMWWIRL